MSEVIKTEVLVIGAGGAGCRAAIEAYQAGAEVTLVVKGRFGWRGLRGTGATSYNSNFYGYFPASPVKAASLEEEQEIVFKRIIQAGLGLTDRKLARVFVENGLETRKKMDEWGIILPKTALIGHTGAIDPGETYIARPSDPNPGLANVIRGKTKISVIEQTMVTDLLIQDGVCVGAIAINEKNGEPVVFAAGSTILATGGQAQLYRFNRHPTCVTGDGYAMGLNAGAELFNLEFIYTDIGSAYPNNFNIMSDVWSEHPIVKNSRGEEFISNYLPTGVSYEKSCAERSTHNPFSARDLGRYIDIALTNEIRAGRVNEHGACLLEGKALRKVLSQSSKDWNSYLGIDLNKEFVEITMIYHCSHGGLRIDENAQTTVPQLYAVGEVAAGMHGADRLGGAMIGAGQVFARKAGLHAADKKRRVPIVEQKIVTGCLNRINEIKSRQGKLKPVDAMKILKSIAWQNLLSIREGECLKSTLKQIQEIRKDMIPNLSVQNAPELVQAIELNNMMLSGEMVARSALMRTESRGTHYREDYPEQDDSKWTKAIFINNKEGEMELSTRVVDKEWKSSSDDLGGKWWA